MEGVIVALISLVGSLGGTFGGIVVSSKLTTYRIEQLEKKVEAYNKVKDRTFELERRADKIEGHLERRANEIEGKLAKHEEVYEEKVKVANHRIDDLEKEVKRC